MKIYKGYDTKKITEIKRLVNLKAALGICEWAGDFKNSEINCSDILDYIDKKLEEIKESCCVIKDMDDKEDREYFAEIRSLKDSIKNNLSSGVIDSNSAKNLSEMPTTIPPMLNDIIANIDEGSFLWIV